MTRLGKYRILCLNHSLTGNRLPPHRYRCVIVRHHGDTPQFVGQHDGQGAVLLPDESGALQFETFEAAREWIRQNLEKLPE